MVADYYVRSQDSIVETWSLKGLSFEAKGWQRKWKDELKASLLELPGSFLAARYDSPIRDYPCDAENILFYNVGGAFATSTQDGLRFERLFSRQPCPVELNGPADHYHRYVIASPQEPFDGWEESKLLAEFTGIELPWLKFDSNPALVWFPLRQRGVDRRGTTAAEAPFALRLRLEVPAGASAAAALAKCLFDGAIAGLQAHNGWRNGEIARWMSERFGFDPKEVERLLADRSDAVLSTRCLFNKHGAGFQWAPDDHLYVGGELVVLRSQSTNTQGFRLEGKAYAVTPRRL
jgi:hypothetical protein